VADAAYRHLLYERRSGGKWFPSAPSEIEAKAKMKDQLIFHLKEAGYGEELGNK
jgi:hypothetical protein